MLIYKILNTFNNKCYIGSTINFARRKQQHFWRLRNNRHENQHLQKAFNKYGETYFEIVVLESDLDATNLIVKEQHYLDTIIPEYNIRKIAESNLGIKHTATTKQKIKKATKKYCKPVLQYDLGNNLLGEWNSVLEAATTLNLSSGNISRCCNGKLGSYKGFVFQFKKNPKSFVRLDKVTRSKISKANGVKSAKKYALTYKNGKVVTFTNFSAYCRKNSLKRENFKYYINKDTMNTLGFTLTHV